MKHFNLNALDIQNDVLSNGGVVNLKELSGKYGCSWLTVRNFVKKAGLTFDKISWVGTDNRTKRLKKEKQVKQVKQVLELEAETDESVNWGTYYVAERSLAGYHIVRSKESYKSLRDAVVSASKGSVIMKRVDFDISEK